MQQLHLWRLPGKGTILLHIVAFYSIIFTAECLRNIVNAVPSEPFEVFRNYFWQSCSLCLIFPILKNPDTLNIYVLNCELNKTYTTLDMNCQTIRTPDISHICKHDLKIDQSRCVHTLWHVRQIREIICVLKRISENLNWMSLFLTSCQINVLGSIRLFWLFSLRESAMWRIEVSLSGIELQPPPPVG